MWWIWRCEGSWGDGGFRRDGGFGVRWLLERLWFLEKLWFLESCCFQERWWILKILRFFGRFDNFFWKYRNFRRYAGFALQLCGFWVGELIPFVYMIVLRRHWLWRAFCFWRTGAFKEIVPRQEMVVLWVGKFLALERKRVFREIGGFWKTMDFGKRFANNISDKEVYSWSQRTNKSKQ